MIISVRSTLRKSDVRKDGYPKFTAEGVQVPPFGLEFFQRNTIPVTVSVKLVGSIAVGSWWTRPRTQCTEVHQTGKGDGPVVHSVNNAATVEL